MGESGSRSTDDFSTNTSPADSPIFVEVTDREWERRAVQLGTVAGKAVAVFRKARRQWKESGDQDQDVVSKAKKVAETLRREAVARTEEWRQATMKRSAELGRQAKAGYERTRARAEQVGRDYPLGVVAGAAIVGFVLGTSLRVWRSKRAV
ncbi:MAG TPA: hypothetical protein VIX19_07945 [Terriglobales bacterium]